MPPDSRRRFVDVAVRLFAQHSFAGTTLQMIADELGVTKSAVHHHFHSREDLLTAVVRPLMDELSTTIEAAERHRTRTARADAMLHGYVDLVVRNQLLIKVLMGDAGARDHLRSQHGFDDLINRQLALFTGPSPTEADRIRAAVAMAGIAGIVGPESAQTNPDPLRHHLIAAGRRTLGLRPPAGETGAQRAKRGKI